MRVSLSGARSMLSFVTSQAIALNRIKAKKGKPAEVSQGWVGVAPHERKSPFKRLSEVLIETRNKAARETRVHRRIDRDNINK